MARTSFGLAVLVALAACGGGAKGGSTTARGVKAAALPYKILSARGGAEISDSEFVAAVGKSRAICLGESHSNPHHHWTQLHVIDKASGAGGEFALGMEMFQVPFQGVLNDFASGKIDDKALLSRSGWKDRWGFDYDLYKPIIDLSKSRGMALLALNAPKELTKKLAREGIESLSDKEKAQLPEMKLDDERHRAWFKAMMGAHPHGHGEGDAEAAKKKAEQIYSAQVLWDESMAEHAANWLQKNPSGRVFILAGNGHCHDSAIVGRLKRRGIGSAISVLPVIDDGKGNVAAILAEPLTDFVFVMRLPRK